MVKTKYADAYKEVLVILDTLIEEDYNKIPKEYIEYLKENCNNDYNFYYDTSKNLEQQKLLDDNGRASRISPVHQIIRRYIASRK